MMTRQVAVWKQESLTELAEALREHEVIAVADLQKVRSSQLQEIRKKLRGRAKLIVAKNTILRRAAELAKEKKELSRFTADLTGSKVLLFTDINPFNLIIFLNKNKVRVPAKAGDTATNEIMIPGGNTGLQPGPVISEFGEAKVPTRIESGTIWVAKDTVVARKGDVIAAKLASLLSKLGQKPMEAGLSIVYAYDNGLIMGPDVLTFDLEQYRQDITTAAREAFSVAVESAYLVPETAPQLIAKAYRQAMALAVEGEIAEPEAMAKILQRGFQEMRSVSSAIEIVNKEAAPADFTILEALVIAEKKPQALSKAEEAPVPVPAPPIAESSVRAESPPPKTVAPKVGKPSKPEKRAKKTKKPTGKG